MEVLLQYEEAAQCIGLSPSGSRSHRPDGPKTGHALTFMVDYSIGANHDEVTVMAEREGVAVFSGRGYFASDPHPHIFCQTSPIRRLTASICLTIAVLLRSAGVSRPLISKEVH